MIIVVKVQASVGWMVMSNLYILLFKNKGILKVGKANNVFDRARSLAHLGEVDYEESYVLRVVKDEVFSLESMLHSLLKPYRCNDVKYVDGHTEIYKLESLSLVLSGIDLIIQSRPEYVLSKGIELPVIDQCLKKNSRSERRKYRRFRESHFELHNDVEEFIRVFRRVDRYLLLLLKNKDKVMYQYDIDGGYVRFRFVDSEGKMRLPFRSLQLIRVMFSRGVQPVVSDEYSKGVIVQYNIPLYFLTKASVIGKCNHATILGMFWKHSYEVLKSLPEKSPLCDGDLPFLH